MAVKFLLNVRCILCFIPLNPGDGFITNGTQLARACQDCVRGRCHWRF